MGQLVGRWRIEVTGLVGRSVGQSSDGSIGR